MKSPHGNGDSTFDLPESMATLVWHRFFHVFRCKSSGRRQACGVSKCWQVSSHGRVCTTNGRISHGSLQSSGYCRVKILGHDFYVHRVVASAFLGPPPDGSRWQVHHRDGNPSNNRLDNLEYVTQSQNILASYASLSRRCGAAKRAVSVMWRAVGSQSWTTSLSMTQAAAELGISQWSISHACRKSKVVKGYEFEVAHCGEMRVQEGEEWRQMYDPVSGLEVPGRMVSSLGRLKFRNGRISLGSLRKVGYYTTGISLTSHRRSELVHRIVAYAFLGPPASWHRGYVNHKDLDKGNNAVENLEYVSQSENTFHCFATTVSTGSPRHNGIQVESRPLDCNYSWTRHPSIKSAGRALGISPRSIFACLREQRANTCGYQFRLADAPPTRFLPGEVWRLVDVAALLRERAMRTGR